MGVVCVQMIFCQVLGQTSGRGCHTGCRMTDIEGRFVLTNGLLVENKGYYWTLYESEITIIVSCYLICLNRSLFYPEVFINLMAFLYCPEDETEE